MVVKQTELVLWLLLDSESLLEAETTHQGIESINFLECLTRDKYEEIYEQICDSKGLCKSLG